MIEPPPAAEDGLGPWLAQQWGALAGLDPDLLAQIDPQAAGRLSCSDNVSGAGEGIG